MIIQFIRNYILSIIFGIIILILSVLPFNPDGGTSFFSFSGADKVVHATMYFIFTILLTRGYLRANGFKWINTLVLLASILAYSILIEIIQRYLTSYRSGEFLDVLANLGGIILGVSVVLLFRRIKY